MDGFGTVTWEEFLSDAEAIIEISNEISDHWQLTGDRGVPGNAYLVRRLKTYVPSDYPIDETSSTENEDWYGKTNPGPIEDPFEARSESERPLFTEHHILWSMSYSVPILYFNGWKSDFPGTNPISVEEAQKLVPYSGFSYSDLSQAIHPILGTPFLQLHPCKSQELLQNVFKSKNKLVSWLSTVAPAALLLKVPQDYFSLTIRKPRENLDNCDPGEEDHGNEMNN